MQDIIYAAWTIELNTNCPECKEYVDLLHHPDFWDGRNLEAGQNRTPYSDNLEVTCPECGHSFHVCCEY